MTCAVYLSLQDHCSPLQSLQLPYSSPQRSLCLWLVILQWAGWGGGKREKVSGPSSHLEI